MWDGESHFSSYGNRLIWVDKHFQYDGSTTTIEHENYQYIGVGEKNTNFRGRAKFYGEGMVDPDIEFGLHRIRIQFGGETKTGKAVVRKIETSLENRFGEIMVLGKKVLDIR